MESNANHDLVAEFDQNAADAAIRGAYVLAVDDFSAIRRIIVNCLRQREAYVDEADNGMVAYDKIRMAQDNNAPYDLVFLDIEMPVMDGISLLKKLRADSDLCTLPVIVLSSHSDKDEISQCAKYGVNDYIIKPITKERLLFTVAKVLSTSRKLFPRGERGTPAGGGGGMAGAIQEQETNYAKLMFQRLETIENLPTLPVVLERIKELTQDPTANNERIARIMQDDPSLMANVFKLANSAMYGARERIDSLQAAITRLGMNAVYNIATSMAVLSVLLQNEQEGFNHEAFCRHSIATGIAMCIINEVCREKVREQYSEDFLHLAGLLHDIGKIIIVQFFKQEFNKAARLGQQKSLPLFIAEQKTFGVDHAEVGAWLGRKWNLSRAQLNTIRHHHSPMQAEEEFTDLVKMCHAANFICNLERIGDGGDAATPLFDQRVFADLGLTAPKIAEIIERVRTESKKSEVMMSLLKK